MITINKIKDLVPGILNLYATPIYNVEKVLLNTIHIRSSDVFYKFNFANDSLQTDYQPVKSAEGEIYNINIEGFMPGESVTNNKILNIIRKYKFLVIYQESDGTFRWTGNQYSGLQMEIKYNSGGGNNNTKGYTVSFSGKLLAAPKPSDPSVRQNNVSIDLKKSESTNITE